jgi:hypothetical protein
MKQASPRTRLKKDEAKLIHVQIALNRVRVLAIDLKLIQKAIHYVKQHMNLHAVTVLQLCLNGNPSPYLRLSGAFRRH